MFCRWFVPAAFLLSGITHAQPTTTDFDVEQRHASIALPQPRLPANSTASGSLPAELSGDVNLVGTFGNVRVSAPLLLTLTTRTGTRFAGALSYGAGQCGTSSAPVTGTFDGTRLVFSARLPTCGNSTFELSKVAPGEFEGHVSFDNDQDIGPGSTLSRVVHLEE